ncbi:MAG: hypothetical protein V3S68_09265 [Dehalococcoidia bacterium]
MAPSNKTPVLSLSTLAPDRPVIEIDDKQYEVAIEGDLGLVESLKLEALQPQILAFTKKGPRSLKTLEDMVEASKVFVELIVLDCDKSVTDKLTDIQRGAIVKVFTDAAAINVKPARKRNRTTTAKT